MSGIAGKLLKRLLPATAAEWIVVVLIMGILIALVLPSVYSVGSGKIAVTVRVLVFDVSTSQPIGNAKVAIVWGGFDSPHQGLQALASRFPDADFEHFPFEETDADGMASIDMTFATNSSTRNPARADTNHYWVVVGANGYGMLTTPLRYDETPTQSIRDTGHLFVNVGLYPATASN